MVNLVLEVVEAHDVAKGLHAVQDSVGAREGLDEPVVAQVLVHPERVQRGGVKAREEHVDHDEQVELAVLHPQRDVLVVALELVARGVVARAEHPVVVAYGRVEEVPRGRVELRETCNKR